MAEVRGRFVWYDLMVDDFDKAAAFYSEIAGWKTQAWEGESTMPYTMWAIGERSIGGMMPLPEEAKKMGAPPHWLAYVGTPDVDATAKQAEELGGKILMPAMDIPEVGRFAMIADPQGAAIAAFTPANDMPAGDPGPGDFSWHELMTTDKDAAWDFYEALFGWTKGEAMDMGDMGIYQMYGLSADKPLGGIMNKTPDMPEAPPFWLYYIVVDDVVAAIERVKKLGGQVLNGPMEPPGGDIVAQVMDNQGVAFGLHQPKK